MVDSRYASYQGLQVPLWLINHMNNNSGSCVSVSKKLTMISFSSSEAEFIGIFYASKITMWLHQLLLKLSFPQPKLLSCMKTFNLLFIYLKMEMIKVGRSIWTCISYIAYHLICELIVIKIKYTYRVHDCRY